MASPMLLPTFHTRTGSLVALSNGNRTAQRNHPTQEFNNGVVLSSEPLRDNQLFEVKIDRKVNSWSGSIEIGVTICEPSNLNFPFSATGFRDGTWVMSGMSILCDGHSMVEDYGSDLDQLAEGDRVGVLRTTEGVLHFYVNGIDQGPAATNIPPTVFAVIDLYGKCAQVTISEPSSNTVIENALMSTNFTNEIAHEFLTEISNQVAHSLAVTEQEASCSDDEALSRDSLRFHERCGNLVKLSNNRRTAERRRPLDEFNNGVVMTNRPIKDNEIFEIRLDRLVDKWSGSIEVGITTHNPNTLDFPATMTNMRNASTSRTIMMSGCGILTNGKGTRREYGQFNLDELSEGDLIGLVRKPNGHLHYFINGLDQGVASSNAPSPVWCVVDLYGMAVKVTIVDHSPLGSEAAAASMVPLQPVERSLVNTLRQFLDSCEGSERAESQAITETEDIEKLLFSPICGVHAAVINGNRTAHRPNAADDFNNGVILTNRLLRPNEVFEVRLDKLIDKWAGSIEIGLTTHAPTELDFPSTMTNIRSGTWMMTGNGVMHNGSTVIEDYGQNLDRLKVGDRVGVVRKADGTVHFFVNGIDQGACANGVPPNVYGVIDLYGMAAQATIVDISDTMTSPDTDSSVFTDPDQLKFHHLHGRNATVLHNGLTASRPNATGEFNDAIVMSNRPLRDGELFEVAIEKMVDRWSGSLEAGVTLVKPEEIEFPNTMTDIEHDTWMLSGSAIMQDGATIRNGYPLDLDSLTVGSRIGMMRCSDGTLHYYLDGVDQGVASTDIASGVYAVIDLYGQCAQVSISTGTIVLFQLESLQQHASVHTEQISTPSVANTEITHRLSKCCGKNITLRNSCWGASRIHSYNHGIVFSSEPLKYDEIFEVEITEVSSQWSGSLKIGLTTMAISDSNSPVNIPSMADEITSKVTWIVSGSEVKKCGSVIKDNYSPSLQRLQVGDRVGVCRYSDGTMHVFLNRDDLGEAASGIPKNVFAVIDLYGAVEGIVITSSTSTDTSSIVLSPAYEQEQTPQDRDQDSDISAHLSTCFHANHGKNILIREAGQQAERLASYNQGIVVGNKPLKKRKLFQIRIGKLNTTWSSSLVIGVIGFPVDKYTFPISALAIKKPCIVIQSKSVFVSGCKVKEYYGPNLDTLEENSRIGVTVDEESCLHLLVNGIDYGIAAREVPNPCWPIVDIYGQCEQVTILPEDFESLAATGIKEECEKADLENKGKEKSTSSVDNSAIRHCEYLNICNRLKCSLGLPDGYFESQNICFCTGCHKARGDDPQLRRGDPPKDYVLPFGWCRYVLRAPNKTHSLNVAEKWHLAYHGVHMSSIRRILDCFDLVPAEDLGASASVLLPRPVPYTEKSRPENLGGKQIYLSPTIRHAGGGQFSPKYRFSDPKTKKSYEARAALQVWVKPGSYKVSPQLDEDKVQVDPHMKNSEIDWVTKERGSTLLHALLLKVE